MKRNTGVTHSSLRVALIIRLNPADDEEAAWT